VDSLLEQAAPSKFCKVLDKITDNLAAEAEHGGSKIEGAQSGLDSSLVQAASSKSGKVSGKVTDSLAVEAEHGGSKVDGSQSVLNSSLVQAASSKSGKVPGKVTDSISVEAERGRSATKNQYSALDSSPVQTAPSTSCKVLDKITESLAVEAEHCGGATEAARSSKRGGAKRDDKNNVAKTAEALAGSASVMPISQPAEIKAQKAGVSSLASAADSGPRETSRLSAAVSGDTKQDGVATHGELRAKGADAEHVDENVRPELPQVSQAADGKEAAVVDAPKEADVQTQNSAVVDQSRQASASAAVQTVTAADDEAKTSDSHLTPEPVNRPVAAVSSAATVGMSTTPGITPPASTSSAALEIKNELPAVAAVGRKSNNALGTSTDKSPWGNGALSYSTAGDAVVDSSKVAVAAKAAATQVSAFASKLINQIAQTAQLHVFNTGVGMTMKVDPPNLGTLRLELLSSDGAVTAHIQTASTAVKQALDSDLDSLRKSLADAGVNVQSVTVTVGDSNSGHDRSAPGGYADDRANNRTGAGAASAEDESFTSQETSLRSSSSALDYLA
jgi:flagellar hook-length control protein FliK